MNEISPESNLNTDIELDNDGIAKPPAHLTYFQNFSTEWYQTIADHGAEAGEKLDSLVSSYEIMEDAYQKEAALYDYESDDFKEMSAQTFAGAHSSVLDRNPELITDPHGLAEEMMIAGGNTNTEVTLDERQEEFQEYPNYKVEINELKTELALGDIDGEQYDFHKQKIDDAYQAFDESFKENIESNANIEHSAEYHDSLKKNFTAQAFERQKYEEHENTTTEELEL